jgi:hypothetical protein
MTKTQTSAPVQAEASIMSTLAPMQENLDRFRKASERFSAISAEIATEQANFLQRAVFDTLLEMQTLSRVRGPAEFFELSSQFAWQQTERSLKALSEIGSEACSCWFEALKTRPRH